MKIRNGFVSNSSSSSFILFKYYLTREQVEHLKDYRHYALSDEYKALVDSYKGKDKPEHERARLTRWLNDDTPRDKEWEEKIKKEIENTPDFSFEDYEYYPVGWDIEETNDIVNVSTIMNNYNMKFFCKMIGIDINKCGLPIEEEHYYTIGNSTAFNDIKAYIKEHDREN